MAIRVARQETACALCGEAKGRVSEGVKACVDCLRTRPEEALGIASKCHAEVRSKFGLPPAPPKDAGGVPCNLCSAACVMGEGSVGYCGIRGKRDGRFFSLSSPGQGLLHYYLDPHVCNCCSSWFCPAGTGAGYPKYACTSGPEYGYYNLALFLYGCNFSCQFCQNWTHKIISQGHRVSAGELADLTLGNRRITCWCWFGGSPEPQLPFAVNASRLVLQAKPQGRVLRICFEWNGDGNPILVKRAAELAYESGGNVKFDLKAYDPAIHRALTGRDNRRPLENFRLVYENFYEKRRGVPVLTATTLLVPFYVDEAEVAGIARFISSLDPEIPYSLLVFHPDFQMADLPITPREQVYRCYRAAKRFLKYVNVSNLHLLGMPRSTLLWGLQGEAADSTWGI